MRGYKQIKTNKENISLTLINTKDFAYVNVIFNDGGVAKNYRKYKIRVNNSDSIRYSSLFANGCNYSFDSKLLKEDSNVIEIIKDENIVATATF